LHGLLLTIALISKCQLRAFAAKRVGDRIRDTPFVRHAQNQRGLPIEQIRHETLLYPLWRPRPQKTRRSKRFDFHRTDSIWQQPCLTGVVGLAADRTASRDENQNLIPAIR